MNYPARGAVSPCQPRIYPNPPSSIVYNRSFRNCLPGNWRTMPLRSKSNRVASTSGEGRPDLSARFMFQGFDSPRGCGVAPNDGHPMFCEKPNISRHIQEGARIDLMLIAPPLAPGACPNLAPRLNGWPEWMASTRDGRCLSKGAFECQKLPSRCSRAGSQTMAGNRACALGAPQTGRLVLLIS